MSKRDNCFEFLEILRRYGITKLYHFTDRDNLDSIIANGGLYSWADCEAKGITISKPGGSAQSRSLDKRDGLQNFVRVSFTPQHPMMYVAMNDGRISNPIILEIDISVVIDSNSKFADMNATKIGANVGSTLEDFKNIHFSVFRFKTHFDLPEDEQKYFQAEVLVKNHIPLSAILNLSTLGYSPNKNNLIGIRVAIHSLPADEQATLLEGRFIFKDTMTVEQFMEVEKCPEGICVKRGKSGNLFWTYGAGRGVMKNEIPTAPMVSYVIGQARQKDGTVIPDVAEHMYFLHNEGEGVAPEIAQF